LVVTVGRLSLQFPFPFRLRYRIEKTERELQRQTPNCHGKEPRSGC
jgi:hypothetical protein